jgi:hypothetical protein
LGVKSDIRQLHTWPISSCSVTVPSAKIAVMGYRRVIVEIVVGEDDCEGAIQQFAVDLERFQEHTTVYSAAIRDEETVEPENASDIAAAIE